MTRANSDIIFHECTFMPHNESTVHTHYEELLSLSIDVRKRIVLMHYGRVPDGLDVTTAGFRAAKRFEEFQIG